MAGFRQGSRGTTPRLASEGAGPDRLPVERGRGAAGHSPAGAPAGGAGEGHESPSPGAVTGSSGRRPRERSRRPLRVLIVDDEYPARAELRFRLNQEPDVEITGEAANARE